MKQKQYKYSVLRYRPSYQLDEQVNIGLLFLFPEDGKVRFLYPTQLKRIHGLFPQSNLSDIKSYLTAFNKRAEQLSKRNLFLESSKESLLSLEFLVSDANAFFFSPLKTGFYQSREKILEYYYNSYFSLYNNPKKNYRDETWILSQFNTYLKEKSSEKFYLFQREVNIKSQIAHASFDYAWQNGTLNLIKPLGFDLQTSDSILDKSNLWLGKLTCLKPELLKNDCKIDFLVSEPQNSDLKEPFHNAIDVLNKIDINKEIVYIRELPNYIDHALENIKP